MDFLVEDRQMNVFQDNTVKSPFERKPGMKMSTYGGEKRRKNTRYNIIQNKTQQSPYSRHSIKEESLYTTAIDGDSSLNTIYDQENFQIKFVKTVQLENLKPQT
jgi:hypothetical protein